ncbi:MULTISPECIES: non-ribosomal peptide synthetase [Calothrix]|uniref:Amino acid adenylation domain-containing protein n=2 Tax=Calothrix TaxID=1186 RepID=A0ABR8A4L3_9CYAN|nr:MULTISPECIES: non-ribosomal peptide synthetase [Calothrix]MBD2194868.1 amino acid adenylation domain-containing protein [Calothrix parietina FACHB-288]MBD2223466.1 amino acid adenylation domain-containing protein [Calothrix anomala FACHB-343]
MNIEQLVADLNKQGVKLWVDGEQLRVNAPKGVLTAETRDLLAKNKAELISLLHKNNEISNHTQSPLIKCDRTQNLPLSFAQERLWLLNQLEPDNPFYNEQIALQLHGQLNITALEQSLNQIIARHEALRTNFRTINDQPVQVIADKLNLSILVLDLTNLPASERAIATQQLAIAETTKPFDLANSPLIRVSVLKLTDTENILLITIHHIIIDGWSMDLLMRELATIYSAICNNSSPELPELPIQYADFAVWQRKWLQTEAMQKQLNYWQQLLQNAPTLLELPTDRPRPAIQTFQGALKYVHLPQDLSQALVNFSRQQGATLYMTLFTAFVTLLYRYTGSDDIVVGTPIANRDRIEIERLIGYFANTLVLRTDLSDNPTFKKLLNRVRQQTLEAYAHPDLPFEELVKVLQPQRDLSYTPLFQVMFVLQNGVTSPAELTGLTVSPLATGRTTAKFDLTLLMQNTSQGLVAVWQYNTDLFDAATIERMAGHLQTLLEGMITNPQQQISQLPLLTEPEKQKLLVEWNNTQTDYATDKCIHQLFEEQVQRTPDAVAVEFGNQKLTYHELNCRANQLAHYLRSLGVKPDVLVGLCVERSLEMVVGLLGILKAGGAYLPLDPEYPPERLSFMLEDAQVSVLLTQQSLVDRLPQHQGKLVCLDTDWQVISQLSQENLISRVQGNNLAYVIYTSGSTGKPKGVAINQLPLCNLILWQLQNTTISHRAKTLQFAPISFDVSFQEIFSTWCSGGTLLLITEELRRDAVALLSFLQEQAVERLFLPFVALQQLAEVAVDSEIFASHLREVITAGEQLQITPAISQWFSKLGDRTLHNHYGPSESHVVTTFTLTNPVETWPLLPPIGKPIANTEIYILDKYLQPVPVGVPGELYIGGLCLARGYLNRPELTQDRFILNPFQRSRGAEEQRSRGEIFYYERLYKTGDLARYLPDGNIEYLGRIDNQVKIRGFRIELGEIEAALSQHSDIQACCVIPREDTPGDKRLVAYAIANQNSTPTISELRQYLKAKLPEYMTPSAFVFLDSLPLTPSGKVNRRVLPAPDSYIASTDNYIAPRNPIEELLVQIWSQVLKVAQVSITDNFFELGGHSLLGTQLVSRIRNIFKVELPLRELFATATLAELAQVIDKLQQQKIELSAPPILPRANNAELPLSFAQQRLWFLDQLEPNSALYNIPVALRLVGNLNQAALEQSLIEIIHRHEALRTNFITVDGQPTQIIREQGTGNREQRIISIVDFKALSATQQEIATQQLAQQQAIEPFDLATEALIRATLVVLNDTEHILLVCMHHVVSDGWSMGVFIQELAALYNAYSQGQQSPLALLSIQYADFAIWQRNWLQGDVLQSQLSYWEQQLANAPALLALPTDRPRPAIQTFTGSYQQFALSVELTDKLVKLSQEQGCTLFMTLLAAYDTLLYRYTGQSDILVGTPIANRDRSEIEGLIGFFVNTLVMRSNLAGNPSFSELLNRVREMAMDAYAHQNLPFEMLVDALQPERDLSYTPLFQVMFALQNAPMSQIELAGLTVTPLTAESSTAKFDLSLSMQNTADGLVGVWEYSTDLFDASTIERMVGHFVTLLESIVANPEQKIAQLPLLTQTEQHQLLVEWNNTQADYPLDNCIHQLFEAQVERTPDAVAVVFENQKLTYHQLNCRANQLADYLRSLGVKPDTLVGICVERSLEMVIGLLSILKAGGAYLPLDPDYPQERLSFMLQDAQVSVLLTQQHLSETLPKHQAKLVCLDTDWHLIAEYSQENAITDVQASQLRENPTTEHENPSFHAPCPMPHAHSQANNLAYVIYTSGSTGQPKGVMLTHRNLCNHMLWMQETFPLSETDKVLQKTPFSFDASVWEFYAPLLVGGQLLLAQPGGHADAAYLLNVIAQQQVTTVQFVPSLLRILLEQGGIESCDSLKQVFCGGEVLPVALQEGLLSKLDVNLYNLYGPTEACIDSTYWTCQRGSERQVVPIGRAIANAQVYILDEYLQPVPIGVPGELHIGGAGLARGYLNRPELTQEKFIPNPFAQAGGSKLYKTGDLARYLPDGTIEYLGRIDNQVKIRGFRIELGEIEELLNQHEDVQAACVIAREDNPGEKRLVAYVVGNPQHPPTIIQLRSLLSSQLPQYMIPHAFVLLESLPLTPNAKVDRRALPAPDTREGLEISFVAPRNQIEETLAQIWAEVLRVAQVGIHDNFFELGGDSILSIQILAKAKQAGLQLTLKQLFGNQTIAQLAAVAGTIKAIAAEQGLVTGTLPLTPIQHWFFEQNFSNPHHFNQTFLLSVPSDTQPELLKQALQQLLGHHDALRLRFTPSDSTWQQIHSQPHNIAFSKVDLSTLSESEQQAAMEAQANSLQASLHLSENLVQVGFFNLGIDKRARLLIAIHHLVVDGVSWRILLEDLQTAYQQLAQGKAVTLPAKTTSFKDWSNKLTQYAQSETLKSEVAYWLNESRAAVPSIPADFTQGANTVASADTVLVSLTEEETRALLQDVPKAYNTQINDVLLTALALVLSRWTNFNSVLFNLEGHGREDIIDGVDLSRTVGWFTTIFPVLLELGVTGNLADALKSVKEQLRAIPNKGIGYGLLLYLSQDAEISAQLQALPPAQISFNYLGQFDQLLNTSAWIQPASESAGYNQSLQSDRAHLLDINSIIIEERLQINWTYSKNVHYHQTIENLAQEFINTLQQLIAHCVASENGGYTPSDFPLIKLNQQELDRLLGSLQSSWRNIEDIYPLSPMQQGMLFESLYAPDSGVYFEQLNCSLSGNLDVIAFEKAWQQVVAKHSIFRTAFVWENEQQPLQVVYRQVKVSVEIHDWQELSTQQQQQQLENFLQSQQQQGLSLSQAPLMRLNLIQLGTDKYQFIWNSHHILLDGWSLPLVFQDLLQFYQAISQGESLPEQSTRSYRHYIAWLQQQDLTLAEEFWREKLKGFTAPTPLTVDKPLSNRKQQKSSYSEQQIQLTAQATAAIQNFTRQHQLTMNNLVQATWAMLLCRYSRETDVVFGATVSGRPPALTGVESMVGLFINTLPVRVQFSSETQVLDLLKDLQAQQVESEQFSYSSLVEIQGWSEVPRGRSLFESIVVFENYPVDAASATQSENHGFSIDNIHAVEQTNYPLTVVAIPREQFLVKISYDNNRFDDATITRMLGHFQTLLAGIVSNPEEIIFQLPLLTKPEQQQLLTQWNNTQANYPSNKCIHQLFEEQVQRTPDAVAVVYEQQKLTYQELNIRANQLAHHLKTLGVGEDTLVGLCVERSLEMLIGILGILKAGGAYVPLDPDYPADRLAYMLNDSQIPVLLTQEKLLNTLPEHQAKVVSLDKDWENISYQTNNNPITNCTTENLAYVIYTSGSTGKPKGTLVNHANVVRLFSTTEAWYHFHQNDVWTMFHSYAFDFSVWEIWGALLYGGRLVIVPYLITRSPESFYELLCQEKVTILNQTPSAFRQLIQTEQSGITSGKLNLRLVIFGGEALEIQSLQPWFERHGDQLPQLVNMYGITETTVHVTYRPLSKADLNSTASVIGRPIPDLQVYVLDEYQQPVPIGVPGEMYVGGAGVTRGYLNRSDLTAQKFIFNPFNHNSRLYKTGDLARYLPNGELEYLGRIDHQVKIRGFRIELGEIEALLATHPDIWESVVLVREDEPGDKRLVAYIVTKEQSPTATELRQYLKAKLPEYMVPSAFVTLQSLPLTSNGKIDRKALPAPFQNSNSERFVAPRNQLELQLTQIWSQILKVEEVGVKDNFFDLGGHSLLAPYLSTRIKQQIGKEISIATLFQNPTIEQQATILQQDSDSTNSSCLVAIQPHGSQPPLFCLPGAGGTPFYLSNLARCLGQEQPFYSFQANNLAGELEAIAQVEDIAANYIQELLIVQPQGPYFLAGHSFGGKVAFEMAQQLIEKGYEVALVAILDSKAPFEQEKLVGHDWDNAKWLLEFARATELVFAKNLDISDEIMPSLVWEEQLKYVLQRLKIVDILPPDAEIIQLNNMVQILKANSLVNYVPQRFYPTQIALLRAIETAVEQPDSELHSQILQDATWGWSKFSTKPINLHFVPGNHITMMNPPHVQALAECLKVCIKQAQANI